MSVGTIILLAIACYDNDTVILTIIIMKVLFLLIGTLGIMIGTIAVTGSIAMVSLAFNCILLTLLTRKVKNFKKSSNV